VELSAVRTRGLVCVLLPVVLAGCASAPAGADGDLVNGWPMLSPAVVPEPVVGQCSTTMVTFASDMAKAPTTRAASCAALHASETVYVGRFTGAAAERDDTPTPTDKRAAYAECGKAASEYLGDDWHDARVELVLLTPTAKQWGGGARYFRCELAEVGSDRGGIVGSTASMKDGLRGGRPLAITCAALYNETKDGFDDTTAVPCTQSHRLEYAGYTVAPDGPYPATNDNLDKTFGGPCDNVVAKYTGMTTTQFAAHRQIDALWWATSQPRWELGERSARCYVWLPRVPDVRRSVRGMGNTTL
jgi:hypothetical protein